MKTIQDTLVSDSMLFEAIKAILFEDEVFDSINKMDISNDHDKVRIARIISYHLKKYL